MKKLNLLLLLVMLLLNACGGGGSSSTTPSEKSEIGYLIDSPVVNSKKVGKYTATKYDLIMME